MSLFETKYVVISHHGSMHRMTAKQLCERIKQDSKSDYNWISPARELVRVCKLPGFPIECAIIIKVAILNCFANIEHRANNGGDRYYTDPSDAKAVEYCYNSLYGVDAEEAVSARARYLTEMITMASYTRVFDSHYHPGPTYRKLREDWSKSKFEEYTSKKNVDFKKLVESLKEEFFEIIKKAESNGDFEEDEKKDQEEWAEFFKKFRDL